MSALACADCDAPYGEDGWCDVVLPDEVWARISPQPDGGGVLCLRCMTRRLEAMGISGVRAYITSGPYLHPGPVTRRELMEAVCRAASALQASKREVTALITSGSATEGSVQLAWLDEANRAASLSRAVDDLAALDKEARDAE